MLFASVLRRNNPILLFADAFLVVSSGLGGFVFAIYDPT